MFTFYFLHSSKFNKIYIRFTSNLEVRFISHNELGTKGWTIPFRPWVILHTEIFENKSKAMKRENYLNSGRGREFVWSLVKS